MEENLKKLKSVPFRYLMSFQNLALFQSGILGECCNTPRCTDVLGFYRIFQPDAVQRYEKLGGHGNAIAEAFIQRLSWELVKNGEGLPSSSFFLLSFQVSFLELVDLAKKALKSKVESLRLIFPSAEIASDSRKWSRGLRLFEEHARRAKSYPAPSLAVVIVESVLLMAENPAGACRRKS